MSILKLNASQLVNPGPESILTVPFPQPPSQPLLSHLSPTNSIRKKGTALPFLCPSHYPNRAPPDQAKLSRCEATVNLLTPRINIY
jgi:hypothetical protein